MPWDFLSSLLEYRADIFGLGLGYFVCATRTVTVRIYNLVAFACPLFHFLLLLVTGVEARLHSNVHIKLDHCTK